jgi:cyclohexa-1,5-dienecarbonyl-CoA hydratase
MEVPMSHKHIKVSEKNDGEVTEIALGPPPANIVTAAVMEEISSQLRQEAAKPQKKLIVFTGEGKHFSFGASVEEHTAEKVGDMLPKFHGMIGDLINCDIPTIARVSGQCLGGAFELVLACDFIFAARGAKFGVPEIQLGVFPPVACALMPFKCSGQLSLEMALTGERFTAEELHRQGLVNHVTEGEQLDEAISSFFEEQIHPKSASSLRMTKAAASMILRDQYKSYIGRIENLYLKDLMATADAVEGLQAFLSKRQPEWKNE